MELSSRIAITPHKQRARLYREHKYVFFVFSDLVHLIGSLDFTEKSAVAEVTDRLQTLEFLLKGHADYEESRIHIILKHKNSFLYQSVESQHKDHQLFFDKSEKYLREIEKVDDPEDKNYLGYLFYLDLREFFAQNLIHFDYEEKVILPELQRLATDEDIREIDAQSYRQMLPDQLIHMMEVLFPHMNREDRLTFLKDIKDCQPDKFELAWQGMLPKIDEREREALGKSLNIP